MRRAVAILLLIPFALVGTLVGGFISGLLIVIAEDPGRLTKPAGVIAAAGFVGMQGAVPASLFIVPASLLAFPLAYYLRPPRGHSALNWTLHCAALGVGLAVLAVAGIFAFGFFAYGSGRIWDKLIRETWSLLAFLVFHLSTGLIIGALFGFAKYKLNSRRSAT